MSWHTLGLLLPNHPPDQPLGYCYSTIISADGITLRVVSENICHDSTLARNHSRCPLSVSPNAPRLLALEEPKMWSHQPCQYILTHNIWSYLMCETLSYGIEAAVVSGSRGESNLESLYSALIWPFKYCSNFCLVKTGSIARRLPSGITPNPWCYSNAYIDA